MVLRNYQQEAVNQIMEEIDNPFGSDEIILEAATSFGKSLVISELCRRIDGTIVILVTFTPLIDQISEHLTQLNIEHSILKAGRDSEFDESHRVQLVMAQTYYARLDKVNIKANFVLADEFHVSYNTKRTNAIIEKLRPAKTVGFSATPYSAVGVKLSNDSEIITTASVKSLTEQGFLSPLKYFVPKWSEEVDYSQVEKTAKDYTGSGLDEVINTKSHIDLVVESMNQMDAKNKKTLVFCSTIEHCDAVTASLREDGYLAEAYHSKVSKSDSESIMDAFKHNTATHTPKKLLDLYTKSKDDKTLFSSEDNPEPPSRAVKVLVSVSRLSIGFSVNDIELGVLLRPTKILSLTRQMQGRIMRLALNKSHGEILDLAQSVSSFGFADDPFSPPDKTEDAKENRKAVADAMALNSMELLGKSLEAHTEPQEVERTKYDIFIEELKQKDSRAAETLSLADMKLVFDTTEDISKIIEIGAYIWTMRYGKPISAKGYTYKMKTNDLVSLAVPIFEAYPEKSRQWLKAHRTRIRTLLKGEPQENNKAEKTWNGMYAKSYYGIKYFSEFLEKNHLEELKLTEVYSDFKMGGYDIVVDDIALSEIPF